MLDSPDATVPGVIERLSADGAPLAGLIPSVLIVLRDPGVQAAAASLLRLCRYPVLTARTVPEAEWIASRHHGVGVVLTEQVLEGSESGAELVGRLRSVLGASLKAILLSDDPVTARMSRTGQVDHLRVARIPVPAEEILGMMNELRQYDALGRDHDC